MNPQKLHIQDVHNCRFLSVTKYLMSFRNCDWPNEMRRKLFVSEKDLFFEVQLEWLNLHVLEACLPEKHAFIVCKAFKTTNILKSLCTSINISSQTCDMLSSRPQCAVANIPKRDYLIAVVLERHWKIQLLAPNRPGWPENVHIKNKETLRMQNEPSDKKTDLRVMRLVILQTRVRSSRAPPLWVRASLGSHVRQAKFCLRVDRRFFSGISRFRPILR